MNTQVNTQLNNIIRKEEERKRLEEEILRKEYTLRELGYTAPTEIVDIVLTEEDTKSFPLANKPMTYWYEISLNDSTTILGHDDDGAKKIIIYPECEEA